MEVLTPLPLPPGFHAEGVVICYAFRHRPPGSAAGHTAGRALPEALRHCAAARQRDFLAGRACAAQALRKLGVASEPGRDARGAPVWPVGTIGSLSHAGTRVLACAARAGSGRAVGIDVERMAGPEAVRALEHLVIRDDERSLLSAPHCTPALCATLIFSSKEAWYKSLPAQAQPGRAFGDVAVRAIDRDSLFLEVVRPHAGWQVGDGLTLAWSRDDDYVLTLCVRTPRPLTGR
ncbi:4'-phosphopantetheinyl transferase [Pantoea sp. 1.19]|uniref:4'-phosphopantetheinyl transferase family protein n=1 Tax=Pantoea sp. 1.19 TaxID=1925589 RepID=UPI00094904A6|nr:4'-phosphopantetheinyl transferase superfamily protein [Pantoea sp. 1.19]